MCRREAIPAPLGRRRWELELSPGVEMQKEEVGTETDSTSFVRTKHEQQARRA